ncbi:MAG: Acetylornithine aminotransferase [Planctomycetota bacterium]|jgi:4-aminobutyrate aminotransferase-like enzyme
MARVIDPIQFAHEDQSNAVRRGLTETEPACQRTYTPTQAVIARSAGAYHWTPEGRKLADFTSGVLVANLGHNPVGWWHRVMELMQLDAVAKTPVTSGADEFAYAAPLTSYNAVTPLEVESNRRLVANLRSQPGGGRMEQVLWAASGSEAIQKALWASMKRSPGRDRILATRRGYHGKKGLANAVTGSEQDADRDPRVHFIRFPTEECSDVELRRKPLDLTAYDQELKQIFDQYGSRICALITEPYLGGGGSFHPQPEYMQLLQRYCRQHDVVFIFDEIQSNFGRTGPMYAFTHYGVEPDIVCLGKGLGNGVPVSASVGSAELLGTLNYGEGSDTFSAHPLACAAVIATLDAFENTDVLARGQQLAGVLERGLVRLKETGVISRVRGEGCVWGIECGAVGSLSPENVAVEVVRRCYLGSRNGFAVHLLGPLAGRVLRVSPPLIMDLKEAEQHLAAMFEILSEMAAEHRS